MKILPSVARIVRKLPGAFAAVLRDAKRLETPTVATGAAGLVAPVIAAVAGAPVTAAEVGPWLVVVGLVAGAVQKLTSKPTPPAAPPATKTPPTK